jgi:hypothetical protein
MQNGKHEIDIINELSSLAARHRLIPFLGAGCSQPHLQLDWQSLTSDMAEFLNIDPCVGPLSVAQKFVEKNGKGSLCDYLGKRFLIDKFEDSLGTAYLAVLSLGIGLIYTTNQDNVFEQCAIKYQPRWRPIIQLEDLVGCLTGEPLYIKYHGDLSCPGTVIFSEEDYESRIKEADNFLNIRLRSDLLERSILFLGYSFSDGTIRNIFRELRVAFREKLPKSYLIAYKSSPELEEVCREYQVHLVDPFQEFHSQFNFDEAFERFLTSLVNTTYSKKTEDDVKKLVGQRGATTQRLVTKYEIQAMEHNLPDLPFKDAVNLFRNTFDLAKIPRDFQKSVVRLIEVLSEKCLNRDESDELSDLLFTLQLDSCEGLAATSAVFSTANCRGEPQRPGNYFFPRFSHGEFDDYSVLIVAVAIQRLKDRNEKIRKGFKYYAKNFISQGMSVEDYDEPAQEFIKEMFKEVWDKDQSWQIPKRSFCNRPKYKDLLQSLRNKLPRSNKLPENV